MDRSVRCILVLGMLPLINCMAEDPQPPAKRPIRVLLMADVAGREFQFVRTALQREPAGRDFRCSQLIQATGDPRGQAIIERGSDKILTSFPDHLGKLEEDRPEEIPFNLAAYDVLIAFDFHWAEVKPEQQQLLRKWVEGGGGLILVAGAVRTPLLASPRYREQLKTIRELYPVEVADLRLQLLDRPGSTLPQRLQFTRTGREFSPLALRQKDFDRTWESVFGNKGDVADRGFFQAYPVEAVKPGTDVLATWGKEVPYLVRNKLGSGQILYIGSAEFYRLREVRIEWHEGLWSDLILQVNGRPR